MECLLENNGSSNYGTTDDCNALILPSKKKNKNKLKDKPVKFSLNQKKRKKLEKILREKKKKEETAKLFKELSKTNVPDEEIKQYVTLTSIQTKGLKRHIKETKLESQVNAQVLNDSVTTDPLVSTLKSAKKRKLSILSKIVKKKNKIISPDVHDIDESSDDQNSENEVIPEETDQNENKTCEDTTNETIHEKIQKTNEKESITQNENLLQTQNEKKDVEVVKILEKKPAVFISVNRKPEIQEARMKLPILSDEQIVIEAINENPVVIITGETGSGKTTQVPQFLYEAGYAQEKMIGVTEPRRVAAISMSKRIAEEMNLSDKEVSYLIRFEGNTTPQTKIKFMTDGVLLKEIQSDFDLKKYSVIILDEAHERSVYTDILIGFLTRIAALRLKKNNPLKLIIMSATLRVDDFLNNSKLFKVKPQVINVESRQFPVTIHFNRRTETDYVKEAIKKAAKIHTQLPEGGILIFLTGKKEVNTVVRQLRKAFPNKKNKDNKNLKNKDEKKIDEEKVSENEENSEDEFFAKNTKMRRKKIIQPELPKISLDAYSRDADDDDLIDDGNEEDDIDDIDDDDELVDLSNTSNFQPLWVLPLYSLLSSEKQAKVFERPPEGHRLCVVSTNVAETSLTIPYIKYVVDSGKCKKRMYDKVTGVTTFAVTWTSKAAANQRAGRAGRTAAGHCYRLYSSAVFNDQFEAFSEPEILRKPIDDLFLQLKVMNIGNVVNFPFPTPPGNEQLKMAEKRLCILGALKPNFLKKKNIHRSEITDLGKMIAAFPVLPRYGKMLVLSQQHNLMPYTVCMVAALSVQELLVEACASEENTKNHWMQTRRSWAGTGHRLLLGDLMVLIAAVGAAEFESSKGKLNKFCEKFGLQEKALTEIRKLRQQLTNEILLEVPDLELSIDPKMQPPTDLQAKLLRQVVLSGMSDQIAHKLSSEEREQYSKNNEGSKTKWKHAYKTLEMEDPVFLHSSSVLRKSAPEWVVYQELYETNKIYMRNVTAIEPEWLPKFAPTLCTLNDPMLDPSPRYDEETGKVMCHRTGTIGRAGWELLAVEVEFPKDLDGIKWFARFFLEGKVFPKLEKYVTSLLSAPSSLQKSWAKLLPRVEKLTKLLLSQGIMTRDSMIEAWEKDSNFLLSEYQKWLPESAHAEVMLMWPPL